MGVWEYGGKNTDDNHRIDGKLLSPVKSALDTRLWFDRLTTLSLVEGSRETDEATAVPPVAGGG